MFSLSSSIDHTQFAVQVEIAMMLLLLIDGSQHRHSFVLREQKVSLVGALEENCQESSDVFLHLSIRWA